MLFSFPTLLPTSLLMCRLISRKTYFRNQLSLLQQTAFMLTRQTIRTSWSNYELNCELNSETNSEVKLNGKKTKLISELNFDTRIDSRHKYVTICIHTFKHTHIHIDKQTIIHTDIHTLIQIIQILTTVKSDRVGMYWTILDLNLYHS